MRPPAHEYIAENQWLCLSVWAGASNLTDTELGMTPTLSYPILSYPNLSCPTLSYPDLSYPVLFYPILSYSFALPSLPFPFHPILSLEGNTQGHGTVGPDA